MRARWKGTGIPRSDLLTRAGDIGIGAENYHENLMVRCPVCDHLHVVPIPGSTGTYRNRWGWNGGTLTLTPSARFENHRGVCHWTLTYGVFTILPDSTAKRDAAAD